MTEFPDGAAAEWLQQFIDDNHGFLSWLGTTVEAVEEGRIALTVPYDEKLTNPTTPPSIHGGVAATLVDTAGGLALRTTLENPVAEGVATINLNVNYLRRAEGDLTATADVIRSGNSVGVSEVTVESPSGDSSDDDETRSVATGQGSYRLFRD